MKNGRLIVVDGTKTRSIAALIVDGRIEDLLADLPDPNTPVPGDIFRAQVERHFRGLGGAIVNLGGGHQGFLKTKTQLESGDRFAVQVRSVPGHGKAPVVTTTIKIASRWVVLTNGAHGVRIPDGGGNESPGRHDLSKVVHAASDLDLSSMSVEFHASALDADLPDIEADLAICTQEFNRAIDEASHGESGLRSRAPDARRQAMTQWAATETTEIVDEPGSFDTLGVWDMIAPLLEARVSLPKHPGQRDGTSGGPSMVIEPTQALVAIDINTGDSFHAHRGLRPICWRLATSPVNSVFAGLAGRSSSILRQWPSAIAVVSKTQSRMHSSATRSRR